MGKHVGTSRSLTVLLLKDEGQEPGDFIRPDRIDPRLPPLKLKIAPDVQAELFVRTTTPRPPRWAPFFAGHVAPTGLGQVSSASAALVLRLDDSWFALTFGYGFSLLRPERIVEGFGLKTTLNAVDDEALRSIDKETFDAVASQSRHQASRGAAPSEFGIDVERDLLKAVTGKPRDASLGQRLSGKDSLAITTSVNLEEIPNLLRRLLVLYGEATYQRTFRWVDDVKRITDRRLAEKLDAALFEAIADEDYSSGWLAPPDILDWSDVRFFSYSDAENVRVFTDIHWRTLLRNTKSAPSAESFKRKRVYCYGESQVPIRRWSAYNCIYAQIDIEGGTYLLTGGSWYRVAASFVGEIEEWFDSFPKEADSLPVYKHASEGKYNEDTAASSNGHYALLDQKLVRYGRGRSQIEFCDLLGADGEIVHVKRYAGSSSLSHLFEQGLVSAELLRVDQAFREALAARVPPAHYQTCKLSEGNADGRRITFAIIYRSTGPFELPFFAKVALRRAAQRLTGFGYAVVVSRIGVDQTWARLEKLKKQALAH